MSQGDRKRWSEGGRDPHRKGHHQPVSWPTWTTSLPFPSPPSAFLCALGPDTVPSKAAIAVEAESLGAVAPAGRRCGKLLLEGNCSNRPLSPWVPGFAFLMPLQMEKGLKGKACLASTGRHEQWSCWLPCLTPRTCGSGSLPCSPGGLKLPVNSMPFKGSSWETGYWGL